MKASGETKLPRNWVDFLRNSANKELFALLTSKVEEFIWPSDKDVYVTSGQAVSSFGWSSPVNSCNHEEADTRVPVHVVHALQQGLKTVQVRTVDTEVVVILAGQFHDLLAIQPLADIWVAFGMGKNLRFYHVNAVCASLGQRKSRTLPIFMRILGVLPPPHSMAKSKSPLGKAGTHTKMSQRSLFIWRNTHTGCWTLTLACSRSWKD